MQCEGAIIATDCYCPLCGLAVEGGPISVEPSPTPDQASVITPAGAKRFWGGVLAVGLAVVVATQLFGPSDEDKIKDSVKRSLLDPESAIFTYLYRCTASTGIWHGSVNGKNRFEGYAGSQSFYATESTVAFSDGYGSEYQRLASSCD